MRISRLEFGFIRDPEGKIKSLTSPAFNGSQTCGCKMYEWKCFYFTVLGDDCYEALLKKDPEDQDSQPKG